MPCLLLCLALTCLFVRGQSALCNVLSRGAKGGGGGDDTAALQRVFDDPSCSELVFPAGHAFSASVLWVRRSDVTVTLEANATLAGLPATFLAGRPDCASEDGLEFNWKDWCALLRITAESNVTIRGAGTIAPGGTGGVAPNFYSALHVRSTTGVTLQGVRVHCTAWWWCTVLHNATGVLVTSVFVDGSTGRDAMDLVNCRDVVVEHSRIEGSDDALCIKSISNDGLGGFPSRDTVVRNCSISSTWDNAIQFGSATEVDMTNFTFTGVTVSTARKSAIGIVSMDGANISKLRFENITVDGPDVATPLFVKIGNRVGCEDRKGTCWRPGSIADVNFTNMTANGWGNVSNPTRGHSASYTATVEGLNASYRVGPIRIDGLELVAPGGGTAADAKVDPPISPLQYQPRYDGLRPAYGLFIRYARDVTIAGSSVGVTAGEQDGRPAIVADEVDGLVLSGVTVAADLATCQIEQRKSTVTAPNLQSCVWAPNAPNAPPPPTDAVPR